MAGQPDRPSPRCGSSARRWAGRWSSCEEDYDDLPELDVAIRNVSEGAAKDITFEFSASLENSGGFVISDLPYFKDGLDFLPPHGELICYWDDLNP